MCFVFVFSSKKFLISFLISVLNQFSFRSELFSIHDIAYFMLFLLLLITHSGLIRCRILFQFSYVCWDLICALVYGQDFWRKFHWLLRRKYVLLCFGVMFCRCQSGNLMDNIILLQYFSASFLSRWPVYGEEWSTEITYYQYLSVSIWLKLQ